MEKKRILETGRASRSSYWKFSVTQDAYSISREFLKVTKFLENQQAAARSNHHVAEFQKVIENRKVELKKVLQDKTREMYARSLPIGPSLIFG